jgi:uncharacterized lipoprotein YmbA
MQMRPAAAAAVWLTGCASGWQQNRTLLGALQVQQQHQILNM